MSMFVSNTERVAVTVDGVNTVYIRPKMPFGVQQKVVSAMTQMRADADAMNGVDATLDWGAYNMALMRYNILGWEGPAFQDEAGRPVPCTPANIERLDPDEPLVDKVLEEIQRRNTKQASPDPNSPTPTGSTVDGSPSFGASSSGVTKTEG